MSRSHHRDPLILLLAFLVACLDAPAPTAVSSTAGARAPLTAADIHAAKASSMSWYSLTFESDLLTGSSAFTAQAKTGDPFGGIGGEGVRLLVPALTSGNRAVCDSEEASLGATANSWGAYAGEWTGTLGIDRRNGRTHFSYRATRVGGGYLNLDVWGTDVDASGLTLRLMNARGLVGATSRPDGTAAFDGTDRCLTFSVVATTP